MTENEKLIMASEEPAKAFLKTVARMFFYAAGAAALGYLVAKALVLLSLGLEAG